MKTITFHSYKGGRGRTTAITSLANLLVRLNRSVVILDLDVGAPWVDTKYRGHQAPRRPGLRALLEEVRSTDRGAIPRVQLDDFCTVVRDSEGHAVLRLLSPSGPDDRTYWSWVAQEFPAFIDIYRQPNASQLWRDLGVLIASADPRPSYLLVDAPAGMHPASLMVGAGMADVALLFTGADDDSAPWTKLLADELVEARDATGPQTLDLVGVRARYPTFLQTDSNVRRVREAALTDQLGPHCRTSVTIDADPRLELTNEIPVPLVGPYDVTPAVRSYARLLAAISPEVAPDLDAAIGLEPTGAELRLFWLRSEGLLVNPGDNEPNVAFKAKTLCAILDHMHDEVSLTGTAASMGASLRSGGESSGKRFGEAARPVFGEDLGEVQRMEAWCRFDSNVGFGRFDLLGVVEIERRFESGLVEVTGNFLARDRKPHDPQLCPLLVGYMRGVVSQVIDLRGDEYERLAMVEIDHPDDLCMQMTPGRRSCGFRVTVRPGSPRRGEGGPA